MIDFGRFCGWHYWGFIDGGFVCPAYSNFGTQAAHKYSQEFTGKLDKNGTEIYEGDLLAPRNASYTGTHEVYWDDRTYGFRLCSHGDKQFDKTHVLEYGREVIGNIYEHPELLKDGLGA
jgi:hypothetical protein